MIPVEYVGEALPDEVIKIITWGEVVENPDTIPGSWARSSVSGSDKWTEGCHACLAIVGFGKHESSPFSFLVHLTPGSFLHKPDNFVVKYRRLFEPLTKSTPETLITGGRDSFTYDQAIKELVMIHKTILGIETEILRPDNSEVITNVYVKTNERMVYIQKLDKQSAFVVALRASRVEFSGLLGFKNLSY